MSLRALSGCSATASERPPDQSRFVQGESVLGAKPAKPGLEGAAGEAGEASGEAGSPEKGACLGPSRRLTADAQRTPGTQ